MTFLPKNKPTACMPLTDRSMVDVYLSDKTTLTRYNNDPRKAPILSLPKLVEDNKRVGR